MILSTLMDDGRVLELEDRPPGADEWGLWVEGDTADEALRYLVVEQPSLLMVAWPGPPEAEWPRPFRVYTVRVHEPLLQGPGSESRL